MKKEPQNLDSALEHLHANHDEGRIGQRLNWGLRAGVLGANDYIVSAAGVVVGAAAATPGNVAAIATAGIAALVAGAFSMAGGEYVSVSTQRDTEKVMITKEVRELREQPAAELAELTGMYRKKRGLSPDLARQVAEEPTKHDALAAHAEVELGIDSEGVHQPLAGQRLLLLRGVHSGRFNSTRHDHSAHRQFHCSHRGRGDYRFAIDWVDQRQARKAPVLPAILRNVLMGSATMLATYLIGLAFGVAIA